MKRKYTQMLIVGLLLSSAVFAQTGKKTSPNADLYVISARAGGVNFASGKVSATGKDGKHSFLAKGDTVAAGDRVSTASDGKAEILLNPGSFVRLAENSELEFASTALDDLRVKINRGSAIFEVVAARKFEVTVATPKTVFNLVKSGVYRVDVSSDQSAKIEVWKGKAQIGENSAQLVKGGQTSTVANGQATAAEKFDRGDKDAFEMWSRDRAKELAKINAKLQNTAMSQALASSYSQNGWNAYNGFGLWVRDPFSRSFCFLPFSYSWNSPYGYFYSRDIWSYRVPAQVLFTPNQNGTINNNQPPINFPPAGAQPGNIGIGGGNNPSVGQSPVVEPSQPARINPSGERGKRMPKDE